MYYMEYAILYVKQGAGPHSDKVLQIPPIPLCPCAEGACAQGICGCLDLCESAQSPIPLRFARLNISLCLIYLWFFLVSSCLRGKQSIMQNKPNFKIGKIALTPCYEKHYGRILSLRPRQNKPNQTQFQTPKQPTRAKNRSLQDYLWWKSRGIIPPSRPGAGWGGKWWWFLRGYGRIQVYEQQC